VAVTSVAGETLTGNDGPYYIWRLSPQAVQPHPILS
jgi:hypothetical protein